MTRDLFAALHGTIHVDRHGRGARPERSASDYAKTLVDLLKRYDGALE